MFITICLALGCTSKSCLLVYAFLSLSFLCPSLSSGSSLLLGGTLGTCTFIDCLKSS